MPKNPVIYNGERFVGGTAAWIKIISMNGGWYKHHTKLYKRAYEKGYEQAVENFTLETINKHRLKSVR